MNKLTADLREFWDIGDIEAAKRDLVYLHGGDEVWSDDFQARMLRPILEGLPPPPARILDYGCGVGRISRQLLRVGYEVVGVDVSENMLVFASKYCVPYSAEWLLGDGYSIPLPDCSVDAAVCYYVFQHMPVWEMVSSVLKELSRCLRPEASLFAQTIDLFACSETDCGKISFVGVRQTADSFGIAARAQRLQIVACDRSAFPDHAYIEMRLRKVVD